MIYKDGRLVNLGSKTSVKVVAGVRTGCCYCLFFLSFFGGGGGGGGEGVFNLPFCYLHS